MRPDVLFPLFASAATLGGVGPRTAALIARLAGVEQAKLIDLAWHLPSGIIDRRFSPPLATAPPGQIVTLDVTVEKHFPAGTSRRPHKVLCSEDNATVELVFFNARRDYLEKLLPVGARRVISGRVELFDGRLQMTHPDHVVPPEQADEVRIVEPVYGLTEGLTARPLRKAVRAALERAPELPDWLDPALSRQRDWRPWRMALLAAHAPEKEEDLQPATPARMRLAYDELLANQLALALIREHMKRRTGLSRSGDGRLRKRLLAAFPYRLTKAQTGAVGEIERDLKAPGRMLRLLQGDVGSGKTVVALLAMLIVVEGGGQAALLAPTELLARQHMAGLAPLAEAVGARLALLTGRDKGKPRRELLERLAQGEIDILVGTHALFQEDVAFKDLGLAVIDEQHRFGVHQRLALGAKGEAVDLLVMTATPIPRTLTLTLYGDMEVSRLMEKPPGRKPVNTRTLPLERLDEVFAAVGRAVAGGARVYWVCPLIEESIGLDVAAAEARHADLAQRFGKDIVGLVHGRMKSAERDAAMADFAEGRAAVLVATTVIEVGIDVPEASIIVIEHAERFGLAQLHQLRGRVGRGGRPGTCLLLYAAPLGETARARLAMLRETEDGFRIAEEDLRLRGAGELLGTRQSGVPTFRLARLPEQDDLLQVARQDARMVLEKDPQLTGPRGKALRVLLYLFERDAAVRYLVSG
jgi:ATP-dependent DNA helicase RecG